MSTISNSRSSDKVTLQQTLRHWISTELPDLPEIPTETLDLLTQHDVTQRLFSFVTTRVHTVSNVRDIRAALKLTLEGNKSDGDDLENHKTVSFHDDRHHDKVATELRQQIQSAQEILYSSRACLAAKPRRACQTLRSKGDVLNDGYDGVFIGRGGKAYKTRATARTILMQRLDVIRQTASEACAIFGTYDASIKTFSAISPSSKLSPSSPAPNSRTSTIAGQLQARVSALTADALVDAPDDTHLFAYVEDITSGDDAHTIARLLQPIIREAARRRAYSCDSTVEDAAKASSTEMPVSTPYIKKYGGRHGQAFARTFQDAMDTARDFQLRAGAVWRARGRAANAATTRASGLNKKHVGDYGQICGLYAKMDGERAVLEFVTQPSVAADWAAVDNTSSDVDAEAQLREERESAYVSASGRIDKLERAIARILGDSLHALDVALSTVRQDAQRAPLVRDTARRAAREARHAADVVETAAEHTRRWHGTGGTGWLTRDLKYEDESSVTDLRMTAAENWKKTCAHNLKNLRIRTNVVVEDRAQTLQKVERNLMDVVKNALEVEAGRRETQAASALKELRTWAAEPAREVVGQLVADMG